MPIKNTKPKISLINRNKNSGENIMNKETREKLSIIIEDIEEQIKEDNLSGAVEIYTDFVIDNAWILEFATLEETYIYGLLGSMPTEVLSKTLMEIAEKDNKTLTEEEKNDIINFSTEALQMTIINMWLKRASGIE